MSEAVIVAIVIGGLSLVGVIITCFVSNRKTTNEVTHKLKLHQAVTDTKLEALRDEVHKHNNLIERTYKLEKSEELLQEKMQVVNHRIDDLKSYQK